MKTVWAILFILALGVIPAGGALGQPESSVSVDQAVLRGQIRQEVHPGYRLHRITTPNGTIIREYVSPAGKVFGISWQGPFIPDLKHLLGEYQNALQSATPAQTAVHPMRGAIVKTSDFVFASGGHMGFWRGHAYVPSLMPAGVAVEVIR
jgi:hypothetical protein